MSDAAVTLLSCPDVVTVGVPFQATFHVLNRGNEYFIPGEDNFGTWNPQDGTAFGINRIPIPSPWIWPGNSVDVTGTFTAVAAGTFPLQMRMLREGQAWYGDAGTAKAVTVVGAAPGPGPTPPTPTPQPNPPTPGVFPPPRKDVGDLVGGWIVNTGPFPADAAQRVVTWTAPARLLLRAVRIWLGVNQGGRADCHGELTRADGSLVAVLQADHYTDGPEGASTREQDWAGHYLAVEAGETLTFRYFAAGFVAGTQAHFTVAIWAHHATAPITLEQK